MMPKAIALRNPERIACLVAPPLLWLSRISSAPVRALIVSTNAVLRVIGQGKSQESPFVSEEEVRYLVHEGVTKGIFEKVEEELVHNVFEFGDTLVREFAILNDVASITFMVTSFTDANPAPMRISVSCVNPFDPKTHKDTDVLITPNVPIRSL